MNPTLRKIDCVMVKGVEHFAAQDILPFDIIIGKCTVLEDPFSNTIAILDMTTGART